ncbi:MAG: hypothetical protein WBJ37_05000, partial [Bacteroidales bacterium]
TGQADFNFTKPYSEKTAELIDKEVKKIVDEAYQRALNVLEKNKKGLVKLAELLLEKEVIYSEDLEKIFGKRKAEVVKPAGETVSGEKEKKDSEITEPVDETDEGKDRKKNRKAKKMKDKTAVKIPANENQPENNNGERMG